MRRRNDGKTIGWLLTDRGINQGQDGNLYFERCRPLREAGAAILRRSLIACPVLMAAGGTWMKFATGTCYLAATGVYVGALLQWCASLLWHSRKLQKEIRFHEKIKGIGIDPGACRQHRPDAAGRPPVCGTGQTAPAGE